MMSDGGNLQLLFDADAWDSTISFQPGIPSLGKPGTVVRHGRPDQIGRTFHIFDWTGVEPTGTFSVSSLYRWDVSQLFHRRHTRAGATSSLLPLAWQQPWFRESVAGCDNAETFCDLGGFPVKTPPTLLVKADIGPTPFDADRRNLTPNLLTAAARQRLRLRGRAFASKSCFSNPERILAAVSFSTATICCRYVMIACVYCVDSHGRVRQADAGDILRRPWGRQSVRCSWQLNPGQFVVGRLTNSIRASRRDVACMPVRELLKHALIVPEMVNFCQFVLAIAVANFVALPVRSPTD
jgi:hypothetical protein